MQRIFSLSHGGPSMRPFILALLLLLPAFARSQEFKMEPGPKSPDESLKCIKLRPGFKVELMAAEPLVKDPIAFAWGPDGKLWVVEMGDYPLGVDGKGKPGGRSSSSKNQAATAPTTRRPSSSTASASRPASCPGARACSSPAPRTSSTPRTPTATARPTRRRSSSPASARATSSTASTAWSGASTTGSTAPTATAAARSSRSRPARSSTSAAATSASSPTTGEFEAQSRPDAVRPQPRRLGQLVRQQQLQPDVPLRPRRPLPPPQSARPATPTRACRSRSSPARREVYPDQQAAAALQQPAGGSTTSRRRAARSSTATTCSARSSRATRFVSEPVHNLVHREIMKPKGVTFTSQRADDEQKSEFLASSDNWFRPTMIQTGPDGALWVADMYRYVIEHPEVDSEGLAEEARPARRPRQGPHLPRLSGGQEAARDLAPGQVEHQGADCRSRESQRLDARYGASAHLPGWNFEPKKKCSRDSQTS